MSSDPNEDRAYELGDPTRTRYLQEDEEEPLTQQSESQVRWLPQQEPMTVLSGSPMSEYSFAPDVTGYAIQVGDEIFIPVIHALKEGSGQVGKWLDTLSPRCVIVNCISTRLAGMLKRRGWKCEWRLDEEFGERVDHWKRRADGNAH